MCGDAVMKRVCGLFASSTISEVVDRDGMNSDLSDVMQRLSDRELNVLGSICVYENVYRDCEE